MRMLLSTKACQKWLVELENSPQISFDEGLKLGGRSQKYKNKKISGTLKRMGGVSVIQVVVRLK